VKRVVLAFQNYLRASASRSRSSSRSGGLEEDVFVDTLDIMFASWVFDDSADISSLFTGRNRLLEEQLGGYSTPRWMG